MPFQKKQPFQRLRYSDDQLLAEQDLNDDEFYKATLRHIHVRGLHNTWGVALGFYLSLNNERDQVLVGPGLAYDALGRELLLSETLVLPVPELPAGGINPLAYDLALSQRGRAEILERRKQMTTCAGKVPAECVSIRWVLAAKAYNPAADLLAKDLHLGMEVPLGRFVFDPADGKLSGPIPGFRKNAHPLLHPHIATGTVSFDSLGLSLNTMDATTTVVTNDAGFSSTPQYFVFFPKNVLVAGFVGPLLSISQATHNQFRLRATFASNGYMTPDEWRALMEALLDELGGNPVYWMGVEAVAGCRPAPDFTVMYSPSGVLIEEIMGMWTLAMKPFGLE